METTWPPTRGRRIDSLSKPPWFALEASALIGVFLLAVAAATFLRLPAQTISLATSISVFAIAATGLGLLWGLAGQVSLAQGALLGVGAYVAAALARFSGWDFTAALPLAALSGLIAGFVIGLPSLRVGGHYFVILTFAIGVLLVTLGYRLKEFTGGITGVTVLPSGTFLGLELSNRVSYLVVVLCIATVVLLIALCVSRSGWGQTLRATRDNQDLATSLGVNVPLHRLTAFTLAGGFAGVAGQLYLYEFSYIAPNLFDATLSINLLLMVLVGGRRYLLGPTVGAILYFTLPELIGLPPLGSQIAFGLMLAVVIVLVPTGLLGVGARLDTVLPALRLRSLPRGVGGRAVYEARSESIDWHRALSGNINGSPQGQPNAESRLGEEILLVEDVVKRFGGVTALDGVSVRMVRGEILGVIGPNGSGKTTLLNVISGFTKANSGVITWNGRRINRIAPHQRSRLGLTRTFQQIMTFGDLTVRENLAFGHLQAGMPCPTDARLREILQAIGLGGGLIDNQAKTLSWGQARVLTLWMLMVRRPQLIMLDEPFAGVQPAMADRIAQHIKAFNESGLTFIIVEHEMKLLLPLCHRVIVLATGRVLAEGAPDEIVQSPLVQEAYLGH